MHTDPQFTLTPNLLQLIPLLVGQVRVKRVTGPREAEKFAVDRDINVFREPTDEAMNLGE